MQRERFRRLGIPAIENQRRLPRKAERVDVQRRVSTRKSQVKEAASATSRQENIDAARAVHESVDSRSMSLSNSIQNIFILPHHNTAANSILEGESGSLPFEGSRSFSLDGTRTSLQRMPRHRKVAAESQSTNFFYVVPDKVRGQALVDHREMLARHLVGETSLEALSRQDLCVQEAESFSLIIQLMFQDRKDQAIFSYGRQQKEDKWWEAFQDAQTFLAKEEERRNLIVSKEHLDRRKLDASFLGRDVDDDSEESDAERTKNWYLSAFHLALQQTALTEDVARQRTYLEYNKRFEEIQSKFRAILTSLKNIAPVRFNRLSTFTTLVSESKEDLLNNYEQMLDNIMDDEIYDLVETLLVRSATTRTNRTTQANDHEEAQQHKGMLDEESYQKSTHQLHLYGKQSFPSIQVAPHYPQLTIDNSLTLEHDEEKERDRLHDSEILELIKLIKGAEKVLLSNQEKKRSLCLPLHYKMSKT
ncbi:hypothetical protein TraAM80_09061 [Trypanosoma rangeli]|uniref:DUF1663 domain-containing protein n=1 Tax=Trypanosoma rangeli TaxID=5698 RepID=A0A422MXM8_TRYRA|nr:uncharacterized protein TraAM80_09061 [Trypanosoma rangeli]RNE97957.1 hypothetical protein TraAM80_09061 [Trypanosoma rangeli]|eukprot:RNE97957.1 hypothetical protein TraAM80_09061 [Trypanosoma rangeli]